MRAEHLYVHVPFCARRCVYCDFSIAVRPIVPVVDFVRGVTRELERRHRTSEIALSTLYFGGGTPSKLGGEGVARLLREIRHVVKLQPDAEVTLEANPEDVTVSAAREWVAAGINRVSLGVQTFDDRALVWMHRTHDAATAARAVAWLRDAGVENVSLDLIFALPEHLDRAWERDLEIAVGLEPDHLSVYGLTVEPHTPLGRWVARHDLVEAPEESFEAQFLSAHDALTAAGYEHYEVSNYGRPGRRSRHNSAYWGRVPYVGLGPSAHEFDGATRRWNVGPYAEWLARLDRDEDPTEGSETLEPEQVSAELTYLGLRTDRGLRLVADVEARAGRWVHQGWARLDGGFLRLTPAGWLRLDALASDLTELRSRY